jgi:hypothetical protein
VNWEINSARLADDMPEKDETENKKRNLVNRYDNDMRDKDETEKKKDLVNRYD